MEKANRARGAVGAMEPDVLACQCKASKTMKSMYTGVQGLIRDGAALEGDEDKLSTRKVATS
jgi:hypothetical protein